MTLKALSALAIPAMILAVHASQARDMTPADEQAIARSNASGLALVKELSKKGGKNIAISPLSINGMFALLQKGAAGTTLDQIENTLGNTVLLQKVCADYVNADKGTLIANLLVADDKLKLTPAYRQEIPAGELRRVDFTADPDKERVQINKWVEDHTKGEIKELLPPDSLTRQTVMVALNAIAFEGKWAHEFNEEASRKGNFETGGKTVESIMMSRTGSYPFLLDDAGTTVVSLPYVGKDGKEGPVSLVVLMPIEGTSLADYLSSLTPGQIAKALSELPEGSDIMLQLPKFELRTPTMSLSPELKQMGITDIFDPGKADLSRLSPEKGLYLSEVYHQCFIKVDEKGTKAAAGTAGAIMKMSLPPRVTINRPFLWMIYDKADKMILFCGTLDDPSSK